MAAELIGGPTLERDKGEVRADFRFKLTGLQYDRLELSWRDPAAEDASLQAGNSSLVVSQGKTELIAPVHVPEGYFTGDSVLRFQLRDADEAGALPMWQQDYRLGPDLQIETT